MGDERSIIGRSLSNTQLSVRWEVAFVCVLSPDIKHCHLLSEADKLPGTLLGKVVGQRFPSSLIGTPKGAHFGY